MSKLLDKFLHSYHHLCSKGFLSHWREKASGKKAALPKKSFYTKQDTKIMILKQKEHFDPQLKQQLKDYVYDVVGYVYDVLKELPCGMPEYLYQEGFAKVLRLHGIEPNKEYQHHPMFMGEPMEAYLKMDFMIERERGNIVVEAKAIDGLTGHERSQLFSYLIGTGFPIGILVNFATYPKPQIEKYYFDKKDMTITAF